MRWRDMTAKELPDPAQKVIFTSPELCEDTRIQTFNGLDLFNDTECEINVYNKFGYHIAQRKPLHEPDTPSCGLLIDLTRVRSLFRDPPDWIYNFKNEDLEEELDHPCTINVYLQGFLQHYGYFQVNNIPLDFVQAICDINAELTLHPNQNRPLIRSVSCQGYNYVQHCLMHCAEGLELVHGHVTATLTGAAAVDSKSENKFKTNFLSSLQSLLHKMIVAKLRLDVKLEISI
jgi:hypothetical protein